MHNGVTTFVRHAQQSTTSEPTTFVCLLVMTVDNGILLLDNVLAAIKDMSSTKELVFWIKFNYQ